jgi:uncharacterized protein (DUF1330 family)
MAALLLIQAAVTNRDQYRKYQSAVQPLIASFGGRLKASGIGLEVLEGVHDGRRLIVFEFDSMESIRAFWSSSTYATIKPLREGAAKIDVWALAAQ